MSDKVTYDKLEDPFPKYKWPVSLGKVIDFSSDEVWRTISMPGNLEKYHPFCLQNQIIKWPGVDSHDEIHYLNGWVFERKFCKWYEGTGYDLKIGEKEGKLSYVTWRIKSLNASRSLVTIKIYPNIIQNFPLVIRWFVYLLKIKPLLTSYLDSVLNGLNWSMVNNRAVKKNQFGDHPWFS